MLIKDSPKSAIVKRSRIRAPAQEMALERKASSGVTSAERVATPFGPEAPLIFD